MALDPSFVGRTFPPSEPYTVSREKIAEFADALGDDSPYYRDPVVAREAGYADVLAPPTFPIVIGMAASEQVVRDPALGLDYSRVVHGEQRFEYQRPLTAGETVTVTVTVTDIKVLAGNDVITTVGRVESGGEHVLDSIITLVARGAEQ